MSYEKILKHFREVPEGKRALAFWTYLDAKTGAHCAVGLLFDHKDASRLEMNGDSVKSIYMANDEATELLRDAFYKYECHLDELYELQAFAGRKEAKGLTPEERFMRVLAWLEERV